jgi:hypothetical protein
MKFFHNSLLQRRNQNMILTLVQSSGEITDSSEDIEKELVNHFKILLTEPNQDRMKAIQEISMHIPKLITPDENHFLMGLTSLKEVERPFMDMKIGKSLGPNGFTSNFFQKCWKTIRKYIWQVVEESQMSGSMIKSFNATFLALIPKETKENTVEKFRPISLCNVIYKKISKMME